MRIITMYHLSICHKNSLGWQSRMPTQARSGILFASHPPPSPRPFVFSSANLPFFLSSSSFHTHREPDSRSEENLGNKYFGPMTNQLSFVFHFLCLFTSASLPGFVCRGKRTLQPLAHQPKQGTTARSVPVFTLKRFSFRQYTRNLWEFCSLKETWVQMEFCQWQPALKYHTFYSHFP